MRTYFWCSSFAAFGSSPSEIKYLRIRSAIMSWILCFLSYSVLSMSSQTIARVSAPSIEGWGVESWCFRSVRRAGRTQESGRRPS